jgi:hypothetical protein
MRMVVVMIAICAIVCDIQIRRVRSYAHVSSLVRGVAGIGGGA